MAEITPAEQIRLNLLSTLNYAQQQQKRLLRSFRIANSNISCLSNSTAA